MKEPSVHEDEVFSDRSHLNQLAESADVAEHQETVAQALRKHPKAVFWAFLVALSVIMEGYDTILLVSEPVTVLSHCHLDFYNKGIL